MPTTKHAKARSKKTYDTNLLGPCAFNCGYCLAYKKKICLGCRYQADMRHSEGMKNWCPILNCTEKKGVNICAECAEYPCKKQYGPDGGDSMYSRLYYNYIKNDIKPK